MMRMTSFFREGCNSRKVVKQYYTLQNFGTTARYFSPRCKEVLTLMATCMHNRSQYEA